MTLTMHGWPVEFATATTDTGLVDNLMQLYHLSRPVATVLSNRTRGNVPDFDRFMNINHMAALRDPWLMDDMAAAVELIKQHVRQHDPIVVYGDYDTDGITATTVMMLALQELHADAHAFLPTRKDGYGPQQRIYTQLVNSGYKLLITVDNGITGQAEIAYARQHGMDVIVTDHHELPADPDALPPANAIIHPERQRYAFAGLAGVGVAFKLAQALLGRSFAENLDLVALGTIADVMPLTDDNRIMVRDGLRTLSYDMRPGIQALMAHDRHHNMAQPFTVTDVAYNITPKINVINRMGLDTKLGFKLLTTTSAANAARIMDLLEANNDLRKQRQADLVAQLVPQAQQQLDAGHKSLVLVAQADQDIQGIVGLVANDLATRYHVPSIVLTHTRDGYVGSGRAANNAQAFDALSTLNQQGKFKRFGGHKGAFGLTVSDTSVLPLVQDALDAVVPDHTQLPALVVDYVFDNEAVGALDWPFYQQLQRLAPFGTGNAEPLFALRNPRIADVQTRGRDNNTLRLTLAGTPLTAIGFTTWGATADRFRTQHCDYLIGTLDDNYYRGQHQLQLVIKDAVFSTAPGA